MTALDPSNDNDFTVIRAVARYLLAEHLATPPTAIAIDTSANVLAAMLRTGQLTMVVQVGVDSVTGDMGRWLHVKVPDGGMDAYIALEQLWLPPGTLTA